MIMVTDTLAISLEGIYKIYITTTTIFVYYDDRTVEVPIKYIETAGWASAQGLVKEVCSCINKRRI